MKNRLLASLSLAFWGAALLYFYLSGRLGGHRGGEPYLVPGLQPLVGAAGLLLLALAVGMFLRRTPVILGSVGSGGVSRRGATAQILAFVVLNLPVATALCVTQDRFGAAAVRNRGIATDFASLPAAAVAGAANVLPAAPPTAVAPATVAPSASSSSSPNEPPLPGETPAADQSDNEVPADIAAALPKSPDGHLLVNVVDLLMAAEDDTLRPQFDGKTVEMIGQFMPADDAAAPAATTTRGVPTANRFRLVRMFMVCCAADARPVAVNVEAPQPPKLAEMGWTKVVGTVAFTQDGERHNVFVRSQSATRTEPPKEAMLF